MGSKMLLPQALFQRRDLLNRRARVLLTAPQQTSTQLPRIRHQLPLQLAKRIEVFLQMLVRGDSAP
jgi:hypothetical protein